MARQSSATGPRRAGDRTFDIADGQDSIGAVCGSGRRWRARTACGRKLGAFDSQKEAVAAVCKAAVAKERA